VQIEFKWFIVFIVVFFFLFKETNNFSSSFLFRVIIRFKNDTMSITFLRLLFALKIVILFALLLGTAFELDLRVLFLLLHARQIIRIRWNETCVCKEMKCMRPSRLERFLEMGGDVDDF
jgi:hypothetical protein